jgi:hypothetical protein
VATPTFDVTPVGVGVVTADAASSTISAFTVSGNDTLLTVAVQIRDDPPAAIQQRNYAVWLPGRLVLVVR